MSVSEDSLRETGKCAADSIRKMVAALECGYDRIEELRQEKQDLIDAVSVAADSYAESARCVEYHHGTLVEDAQYPEVREMLEARQAWHDAMSAEREWRESYSNELRSLEADAGECNSQDEARERIQEDALSVEVRSGWHEPATCGDSFKPEEFNILLCTGGPAARIRGELDEHGEPSRAWLEVQNWGTPWTRYFDIDHDTLLAYAGCFYFGEG